MNAVARHCGALASAAIALPLGGAALALRPAWRRGIGERLGAIDRADEGGVWLHAASLGELRAVAGLVPGLRDRGLPITVSTATASARAQIEARCGRVASGFMPLDHPWIAERALARVRPRVLALVETEIWPCWIAAAKRRAISVVVVSGRVSEASFARLERLPALVRPTFERLDAVGARSDEDARRFRALGVASERVTLTGDLKFAAAARSAGEAAPAGGDLADVLGLIADSPLLVAGSVHPPEFEPVLDALDRREAGARPLRLVVAPRHLDDVEALVRAIEARGRPAWRRSRCDLGAWGSDPARARAVLILDSHGELERAYRAATLAFVGGTLSENGGHDLLEPIAAGIPVLFGPHTANQREAKALLVETGAGREVRGGNELGQAVEHALGDSGPNAELVSGVERARAALALHVDAVDRNLALLEERIS